MHIMAEALGLTLPGNAPIRAGSPKLDLFAREAGTQIVALIEKNIRPREILTPSAFRNAIKVAISIGASVNCVRHLTASAIEAECDINVIEEFERIASSVPQITQVRPNGPDRIEDLDAAGGCRGVQLRLSKLLDTSVMTVSGRTLAENLAEAPSPDERIIRTLEHPFSNEPGLIIIRGNVAPAGAIVKLSAVPKEVRLFKGPARIFETEDEAIAGLQNGRVQSGDVIVLRGLGPKGGPGTVFAASFMAALVGAGLGSSVAVVTDGELSGLNSGITIGQVMPEAAEGGPLAVLREDETILVDLSLRRIDVDLPELELQQRLEKWSPPETQIRPGWLAQYRQLVQPLAQGAVLGKRQNTSA
jgi:dihydroxy-acid dehydratase